MIEDLEMVLLSNGIHPNGELIEDLERWAADRLGAAVRRLPPSAEAVALEFTLCETWHSQRQAARIAGVSHVAFARRVRKLRAALGLPLPGKGR
jgi:hypothetical protein